MVKEEFAFRKRQQMKVCIISKIGICGKSTNIKVKEGVLV